MLTLWTGLGACRRLPKHLPRPLPSLANPSPQAKTVARDMMAKQQHEQQSDSPRMPKNCKKSFSSYTVQRYSRLHGHHAAIGATAGRGRLGRFGRSCVSIGCHHSRVLRKPPTVLPTLDP